MDSIAALASHTNSLALASAAKRFAKPGMLTKPDALANPNAQPNAKAKARANAVEFEGVFLNSMFSQMLTSTNGEGPFGGGGAGGVWRSFLTEEYSKSFAKAGGIGLADDIYRSLIAHQEAKSTR
jgi:peptidoglycan hydrolase FlgJ